MNSLDKSLSNAISFQDFRDLINVKNPRALALYLNDIFETIKFKSDSLVVADCVRISDFIKFTNLPVYFAERLVSTIFNEDKDGFLPREGFFKVFEVIYFGSYFEVTRLLFSIYDSDNDGLINATDIKHILQLLPFKALPWKTKSEEFLQRKQDQETLTSYVIGLSSNMASLFSLSFDQFVELTKTNSDLFIQPLCFLLEHLPINQYSLWYYEGIKSKIPFYWDYNNDSKTNQFTEIYINEDLRFSSYHSILSKNQTLESSKKRFSLQQKLNTLKVRATTEALTVQVSGKISKRLSFKNKKNPYYKTSKKPYYSEQIETSKVQEVKMSKFNVDDIDEEYIETQNISAFNCDSYMDGDTQLSVNDNQFSYKSKQLSSTQLYFCQEGSIYKYSNPKSHNPFSEKRKYDIGNITEPDCHLSTPSKKNSLDVMLKDTEIIDLRTKQENTQSEIEKELRQTLIEEDEEKAKKLVLLKGELLSFNPMINNFNKYFAVLVDKQIFFYSSNTDSKDDYFHTCFLSDAISVKILDALWMDQVLYGFSIIFNDDTEKTFFHIHEFDCLLWITALNQASNYIDITRKYTIKKYIGKGAFGEVFLGENLITKEQVAIKRIPRNKTKNSYKNLRNEVDILSMIKHPNLLYFLEYLRCTEYHYIITEYCNMGNLHDFIISGGRELTEEEIYEITSQVAYGLNQLHSQDILHRDLKLMNIVVHMNDDKSLNFKIMDFGLAKVLHPMKTLTSVCGTVDYMAPEMIIKSSYRHSFDVWSFGVIVYMIVFCKNPFGESSDDYQQVCKSILVKDIAQELQQESEQDDKKLSVTDLLTKCFIRQNSTRISIREVLLHPYIKK